MRFCALGSFRVPEDVSVRLAGVHVSLLARPLQVEGTETAHSLRAKKKQLDTMKESLDKRIAALAAGEAETEDALDACTPPSETHFT